MKFRKKPIVVDAWELNMETAVGNSPEWVREEIVKGNILIAVPFRGLLVKTLNGYVEARKGSYLVRGVKGELYVIDQDTFKETYEEAWQ